MKRLVKMIECYFCKKRIKELEKLGHPHDGVYAHKECEDEYKSYLLAEFN